MELEFSRISTGPVLRGSWIVELDADSCAGDHRVVFPGEERLASGGRSDLDVFGVLRFYFQLAGLGRHVQFRQSFLHIAYAGVHPRAYRSAQYIFPVGGKNITSHGFFRTGDFLARFMEHRVHFSMGNAHGSRAGRNFLVSDGAQSVCRRALASDAQPGELLLASPRHDARH